MILVFLVLVRTINGMLCLHQYDEDDHDQIVLSNPATQTIKLLPPSEVDLAESSIPDEEKYLLDIYVMSCLHGFGYDLVKNDYKVIRYIEVSVETSGYSSDDEKLNSTSDFTWLGENLGHHGRCIA